MTVQTSDRRSRSNANDRGNTLDRRRRRRWLMETYEADVPGHVRCYRCGELLTEQTLTIDRIIPGHKGGTYRRNNIRPACGPCNFGSTRARSRWEDGPEEPPEDTGGDDWGDPLARAWG